MKFDFDTPTDRHNTDSYKWDDTIDEDILPMWVADMDFRTAPCIIDALRRRVDHGVFGYTKVPERYFDATRQWFATRHGLNIDRSLMLYTSGVVPALSATIKALTKPGDAVLVQTPVYNCFFSSIRNNGCKIVENPLHYADGYYTIDFDDLDRKLAQKDVKLMLLCNPHNPGGRVWTPDELRHVAQLCRKHGVMVVSDEIHCEIVFPPYKYTPFASLGEEEAAICVTCSSPSKAFNTAGLQIANIFAPNAEVRDAIDRAININEVCDVNPFGVIALIAAYTEGAEWLGEMVSYLHDNYRTLTMFMESELPMLGVTHLEGTYLAWIDCRNLGMDSDDIEKRLRDEDRVWVNSGTMYGEAGQGFIRINMACPRTRLLEGLRRFKQGIESFIA